METRKSVVAAVTAAVSMYIEAEQQAAAWAEAQILGPPSAPRPETSPWVIAGRMSAMQMRRTWQLRLVR